MNPQYVAGLPPNFNNNPQGPPSGGLPFMPPPLNGAQHNSNQINANISSKMQHMSLDQGAQQNGPYTNGPMPQQMAPKLIPQGQLPPSQMPPSVQFSSSQNPPGQMPPRQSGMMPPQQLPPSQLPPRQGIMPPAQLPPKTQSPLGQLPPTASPMNQPPPPSISPAQMPLRKNELSPPDNSAQHSAQGSPSKSVTSPYDAANPQSQAASHLPSQPSTNQESAPPISQPGQLPPISQLGQMPPMSQSGQMPPMSQPGQMPPMNQPVMSPAGQPSVPLMSQPGMSPMSQPGQMPPMSQPRQLPPMGQPGQMLPMGQPGQMPPMSQSGKMATMSQAGHMPPMTQPGQMPPMSQAGHMPPMSQPGQMPPMNQPGQMPPMNQSGQMPPMSQSGQMPPMGQPGQMPSSFSPAQGRPNFPPMSSGNQSLTSNGLQNNQFQPQPQYNQQPGFPGQSPKPGMPMVPPLPGQNASMVPPLPGQNAAMQHSQQQANYGGQPPYGGQPGYPGQQQQNMGYGAQPPSQQGYPGAQPTGYSGHLNQYGYQQQTAKRLDPDQMPSPIQVKLDDQDLNSGVMMTDHKGKVPPLVTTNFIVQDRGNASPRYIRSSMYSVPATQDMLKQTGMPFCLVVSPMAEIVGAEHPPPLIDFAQATGSPGLGPVRCSRCKAYLCPNMRFVDAGRHFHCVFCKATTEVPMEYTQYLNNIQHYGQTSPEMALGCYEIVATKEYCRNNVLPQPPALIFCVDVSYNAVRSGMVQLVLGDIKNIVSSLPPHQKIGIITYSSSVHFYNINEQLGQPQMLVVGDINDVFVPLSHGLLVEPGKAEHLLDALAAEIPNMFKDNKDTETILLPAVQAGLEALKATDCVGKLIIFHTSLPTGQAPGKLTNRDDRKLLGTDKEKNVLTPQTKAYNEVAQECVQAGCGIEMFLFNASYADVATIGQLARLTGGTLYKYTYFQAECDGERFLFDLQRVLTRPTAYDAVMRVRTSTGIRATDFYGHFFMSNTTDVELATLDGDKGIGIEIKHDDKLTGEDGVYIQVALLYTHNTGQRRLRICNLALNIASQMADVYKCCDLDTIVNFLTKQAIWRLNEHPPKQIKEGIIARTAQTLVCYRKHCASPTSAGQLVLPESMKLLPLYANCLIRSDALSGGSDMSCDDRSWNMQIGLCSNIDTTVHLLYPTLTDVGMLVRQQEPQQLRCSAEKLTHTSVYLLDNTIHMLLWIGLQTPPDVLKQLFGVNSVQEVDTEKQTLPVLQEPANQALREYIDSVRARRKRHMRLTIVRQHDKLETVFRHFLIEDQGQDGSPSYVDFLCRIHMEIRALL